MGDRANVKVVEGSSTVYLYTHWGGSSLPDVLEAALRRKQRWTDGAYLARIIFSEMLKEAGEHALDDELGFGIFGDVVDGAYRVLVVDVDAQMVRHDNEEDGATGTPIPFAEFTAARVIDWQ